MAVGITEFNSWGSEVAGAINIAGTALFSSITLDVPDNDRITFSADLTFDGATTITNNA